VARPLRVEFPGALYHVTSRGNAREAIFLDDHDRSRFLAIFEDVIGRASWICHAYCLMGNHYHLVVETPQAGLSAGMRSLNSTYSQAFNRRHRRVGHVLQGRFHSVLVDAEAYLLEVCRYVVLNPVRAGMVRHAADWPWSSYRATAGLAPPPPWLSTSVLGCWSAEPVFARARYARFVAAGVGASSPWEDLREGLLLGSDAWVERVQRDMRGAPEAVPRVERIVARPALTEVLRAVQPSPRAVRDAHRSFGYTLTEIARHLGIHYSTVSRMVNGRPSRARGHGLTPGARGKI
jgi:REP element-mobilizing transposase RayT